MPGGHGGGDSGLVRDWVQALSRRDESLLTSTLAASMESHLIGFTAEESRHEGGTLKVIPGGACSRHSCSVPTRGSVPGSARNSSRSNPARTADTWNCLGRNSSRAERVSGPAVRRYSASAFWRLDRQRSPANTGVPGKRRSAKADAFTE